MNLTTERLMLPMPAEASAAPSRPAAEAGCRLCGAKLHRSLLDLGCLPLASGTVAPEWESDRAYPLHIRICDGCKLVQTANAAPPRIGTIPPADSSSRPAAREQQASLYAAAMRRRLGLDDRSLVIEIGSDDLLRHFHRAGIPVLGVATSPSGTVALAEAAIPAEPGVFNTETAMDIAIRHGSADFVVANNVLPYVPDLFDFAAGFASILRPNGVISLQVPHLLSLVQNLQFDAFHHDCYAYLSLQALERIMRSVGLRVFDAERLPDNGGSLRVHACHTTSPHTARPGLKATRMAETLAELDRPDLYTGFSDRVAAACQDIRTFLQIRRDAGRRLAAYGATSRGNTLLNACRITSELIERITDTDPMKHGRHLPGSNIPIVPLDALLQDPPDDILILPWTDLPEAASPLHALRHRGTQLWTPMPRVARL